MTLTIEFPFPTEHITSNDRRHWKALLAPKRTWRDATQVYCTGEAKRLPAPFDDVAVQLTYSGIMVTDGHNMGPTDKWVLDGIVRSGLVVDDSDEHMTLLPTVIVRGRRPLAERTCSITITDRGETT